MNGIIESERLIMRQLTENDFDDLFVMLGDIEVMYAWEHGFTGDEVRAWIDRNIARYNNDGYGYFAAIERSTGHIIGQIGLIKEEINGENVVGVGYILDKKHWGKGFATEGAKACINYAFDVLKLDKVVADIRPQNFASRNVAESIGMVSEGEYIKHYNGIEMPHIIYVKRK